MVRGQRGCGTKKLQPDAWMNGTRANLQVVCGEARLDGKGGVRQSRKKKSACSREPAIASGASLINVSGDEGWARARVLGVGVNDARGIVSLFLLLRQR